MFYIFFAVSQYRKISKAIFPIVGLQIVGLQIVGLQIVGLQIEKLRFSI